MKRIILCTLACLLLFSLASCQNTNYRNDAKVSDLAVTATDSLKDGVEYRTADEGYLDDYFETPAYVLSYTVRFAADTNNLNEIGIYHVEDGKADEMAKLLEDYLSDQLARNQTWYDSYIPQEVPKLRDAQVKVFGNYAVYVILNQKDRSTALDAIESALQ